MGKGGGDQTVTQVQQVPEYERQAKQQLFNTARNFYNTYTAQPYPQSTVAPLSPYTQQATAGLASIPGSNITGQTLGQQQNLQNYLGSAMTPGISQTAGANVTAQLPNAYNFAREQTQQAFQGTPGMGATTDALVDATLNDISSQFAEQIMPQLRRGQVANNTYGGTRGALAEGTAAEGALQQGAQAAAEIRENAAARDMQNRLGLLGAQTNLQQLGQGAYNAGVGSQLDAARLQGTFLPQAIGMQQQALQPLAAAGDIDQRYRQQVLDDVVQRYMFQQRQPFEDIQNYASIISGVPLRGGTTSTTQPGPQTGGLAGALGGAATGAGILGAMSGAGGALGSFASGVGGPITLGLGALAGLLG